MNNAVTNIKEKLDDILILVAKSQNIQNYEITADKGVTKGEGFLSEFYTGRVLDKKQNKNIEVAIKKAPTIDFFISFDNVYSNEVRFYSELMPALNKLQNEYGITDPFNSLAKYFVGGLEPKNEFVAMENLKKCGYKLYNKKEFLDENHIKLIFRTYGKFHAASFAFKILDPEKYLELSSSLKNIMNDMKNEKSFNEMMQDSLKATVESFDKETECDVLRKVQNLNENFMDIFVKSLEYRGKYQCIIHGDCWSNNMLFKYKESGMLEDIRLRDFQLIYPGSPVRDLCYFFYSGVSKVEMDRVDEYLDLYYKQFSTNLREFGLDPEIVFPFSALKEDWKEYAIFGVAMGLMIWVSKVMDQQEIIDIINQAHLPLEQYGEIWGQKMIEVRKSDDYIKKAKNLCYHAAERGIL